MSDQRPPRLRRAVRPVRPGFGNVVRLVRPGFVTAHCGRYRTAGCVAEPIAALRCRQMTKGYTPMMSAERARLLRVWHDSALDMQRAQLPTRMSFMGLDLHVAEDVFAPHTDDAAGDPFHRAVEAEVTAGERVLDSYFTIRLTG